MGGQVTATQRRINELNQQAAHLRGLSDMRAETVKTQQAARLATSRFKQMEQAVAEQGKASGITARQINEARKAMENANKAATHHRAELNRVTKALQAAGHDTNKLGDSVQRVDAALARENRELTRQSRALTEATRRQDALNKAKERHNKIMALSGKLAIGGAVGVAGGSAAGRALLNPLKVGMGFDEQMSAVSAITRSDPETKAKLRQAALDESSNSKYTAVQAAGAQEYLGMAGFKSQEILDALPATMALATATRTTLESTADISSNIIKGMGLQATDMTRVADTMANTTTSANVNLTELGESFKMAGPLFSTVKMPVEEAAGAIGLLGDVGIKGTQSGTHLRIGISRLAGPPKMARAELEKLGYSIEELDQMDVSMKQTHKALEVIGISTKDADGNLRQLPDILADINKATAGMGSGDKTETFKKIFGAEAFVSFQALAKDVESGAYHERMASNFNAKGRNQAVAREMADNLSGDVLAFQSHIQTAQIEFSSLFANIARFVTQSGTAVMKWVIDFTKANPLLVKVLGLVAAAMVVLTIAAGSLALAMAGALFVSAQFAVMKGKLPAILRACSLATSRLTFAYAQNSIMALVARSRTLLFAAALWAQAAAANGSRVAMLAMGVAARLAGLSTALAFGLVGVAIAAVVAACVVLYQHWDMIKAFGSGVWEGFSQGMAPVMDMLAPVGKAIQWVGEQLGGLMDWFGKLLNPAKATAQELEGARSAGVSFGMALATAFKLVTLPGKMLFDLITGIAGWANRLIESYGGVGGFFAALWSGVVQCLRNAYTQLVGWLGFDPLALLGSLWGPVVSFFADLWGQVEGSFAAGYARLTEWLGFDPLAIVAQMWAPVSDFFANFWDNIGSMARNAIAGVMDTLSAIPGFNAVVDYGKGLGDYLFGTSNESVAAAVDEAPAPKGSQTVNPKAPSTIKGNQIPPAKPVVNNNVQSTTNVTINGSGLSQAELQAAIERAMAESQRAHNRKVRAGLYDQ